MLCRRRGRGNGEKELRKGTDMRFTAIDIETTGLGPEKAKIIEIGAVKIKDNQVVDTMECLVNPRCKIPTRISELTGITDEMVQQGKDRDEALSELLDFLDGYVLVGQNINFDYSFLKQWAVNHKCPLEAKACDTLKLARVLLPAEQSKKLEDLCVYFGIERTREHRALDDARETMLVFEKIKALYGEQNESAFTPKPLLYKAKKQSPATERQKQYLKHFAQYHGIKLEGFSDTMTKSEASRLTDRLIAAYGKMPGIKK